MGGLRTASQNILWRERDCRNSKECACVVRMGLFRKSAFVTLLTPPAFLLSDFLIDNRWITHKASFQWYMRGFWGVGGEEEG